jgi:methionyl-tRNA formyltransferase
MDEGLDTGDILSREITAIGPDDDARTLHDRLAQTGAELLVKTLPDYIAGKIEPKKQPDQGASYARKITKEDGRLDWTRPARDLWNRVRALIPWPGAHTILPAPPEPQLLKIWNAAMADKSSSVPGEILDVDGNGIVVACGQHSLSILELQREGGRRMTARQFIAGHPLRTGGRLI